MLAAWTRMITVEEGRGNAKGKRRAPALALAKAQAHVASQEKWKHPYYWAAWVLWGLSDSELASPCSIDAEFHVWHDRGSGLPRSVPSGLSGTQPARTLACCVSLTS